MSNLNVGQKFVAEEFFKFLFTPTKEMGIDGPGGVGKSYLMSSMIDDVMPRYFEMCSIMGMEPQYDEVVMTATTNKAAEILAESTKRTTSTLASFMNLKVQDDYTTGVSKVVQSRQWKVHEKKILFIDECSMIDFHQDRFTQMGTQDCKIVYVGDDRQLKPVMGENPVYNRGIVFHTLTEPMRTDVPELLAINNQLRQTVADGVFRPIKIIPGIIDLLDGPAMERTLAQVFKEQTKESRILAYTNNRVTDYNQHIRDMRGLPNEFVIGEKLINGSAININKCQISVEEELTIISTADKTTMEYVDGDVELEVRYADIQNGIGGLIPHVPLPVNRQHFFNLLAYFKRNKNWGTYYHLKNNFPDFRERDAATAYKAQGSSYGSVFIDLADISSCRNADQAARLLYVAFSRARFRIYLYGELASKYGGLIY